MLSRRPRPWSEAEVRLRARKKVGLSPSCLIVLPGLCPQAGRNDMYSCSCVSLSRNCIIPKGTETGSYSARHPWMPWHPQGAREQWQYGSELNLEPLLPHQVRYSCEWEAACWVRPLPTVPGHPRDHLADDTAVACKRNFPWICTCLSNPTRKAGASWRRGESVCMQRTNSTLSPSN